MRGIPGRAGALTFALTFALAIVVGSMPLRAQDDSVARRVSLVRETFARFHAMSKLDLWPGFDPESVALAVYDGSTTWLVNHPSPPAGFTRDGDIPGVYAMPGRLSALTANTGSTLAGVPTATVMADFAHGTPQAWAAVMAHETFHVFQAKQFPKRVANEADLFTYPFGRAGALALRRLEFEALRRAVLAASARGAACWGRVAMDERAVRFARIGAAAATYERMTELHEGLAQYVQTRAEGREPIELLPDTGFGTDAVRDRGYRTGLAMGTILDRLSPGWRLDLEHAGPGMTLDGLLTAVVGAREGGGCAFTAEERAAATARARADSAARGARLAEMERNALSAPGWTVRIESGAAPLQLASFDPLNVVRLGDSRVLHSRMIELALGEDSVQVLQHNALTDAAGSHPLFSGVRRLTVPGVASGLVVRDSANVLEVRAEGLTGRFAGARADTAGAVITVHLP